MTARVIGHGSWNYRLVRHTYPNAVEGEQVHHELHEVFYNEDGSLYLYRPDCTVFAPTVTGAKQVWAQMKEAFDKPVLDERDFPEGSNARSKKQE